LCISSYSKTLSRRIVFALFSQPVVGFSRPSPGLHPWTPLAGGLFWLGDLFIYLFSGWGIYLFGTQTPNLPTPGKNPAGDHGSEIASFHSKCCITALPVVSSRRLISSNLSDVALSLSVPGKLAFLISIQPCFTISRSSSWVASGRAGL